MLFTNFNRCIAWHHRTSIFVVIATRFQLTFQISRHYISERVDQSLCYLSDS